MTGLDSYSLGISETLLRQRAIFKKTKMPSELSQSRRTQSKLLVSKLLDSRDSASPFTLIIDSLEQSARPLWQEYIRRAKVTTIKHVSFLQL